jgi:hypothetical protein
VELPGDRNPAASALDNHRDRAINHLLRDLQATPTEDLDAFQAGRPGRRLAADLFGARAAGLTGAEAEWAVQSATSLAGSAGKLAATDPQKARERLKRVADELGPLLLAAGKRGTDARFLLLGARLDTERWALRALVEQDRFGESAEKASAAAAELAAEAKAVGREAELQGFQRGYAFLAALEKAGKGK